MGGGGVKGANKREGKKRVGKMSPEISLMNHPKLLRKMAEIFSSFIIEAIQEDFFAQRVGTSIER